MYSLDEMEQFKNIPQHIDCLEFMKLIDFCLCFAKATANMKIFDPFLGSGTTALSCQNQGIDWWGCELQQKYIDVINNRLKNIQINLFDINFN